MSDRLSKWASIAEIFGAIAIVVSLLFVGLQINGSNRETRAATIQAAIDSEMAFQSEIARYAGTWEKVARGETLAPGEELRRGIVLYNMMMTLNENRYLQMNEGFLNVSPDAVSTGVDWPIYEDWQNTGGYTSRSQAYKDFLDSERQRLRNR